jgi:hypothetical protein
MNDPMPDLIHSWAIEAPALYVSLAALGSFAVRLLSCTLKAMDTFTGDSAKAPRGFRSRFWVSFRGFGSNPLENDDYWHPFVLGCMELVALPVLMVMGAWNFVGAWVAFKALGNWKVWTERRSPFNRFLICNLAMLLLSFLLLSRLVHVERAESAAPPNPAMQPRPKAGAADD